MKRYCFCWKMRQWIVRATATGMLIYLPEWTHSLASEYAVLSLLQTHPQFPLFCSVQSHWQEHRKSHSDSQCPWKIVRPYTILITMHGQVSIQNSSSYFPWTSTHTNISTENRYPCTFISYLPCTTIGLFPHFLCTTNSRLVAATMVLGLVQRPSGVQLLSCSCVTLCTWPDWR